MKVCVLGGGRQGRVIAKDLAPHAQVTVVDAVKVDVPGATPLQADLSDPNTLTRIIGEHDLAVGALPARLGYQAACAAIEARRNFVDIAFYPENAKQLDADAKKAGISILPDCGLAPGITNLVVGRWLAEGPLDEAHLKVGGFAADPLKPYGYVITWSPSDLLDEYTRPARIMKGGKATSDPALSGLETVQVEGVGKLEAFLTDGLRTLLDCGVPEMTEKTLRWPGHAAAVRPLVAAGTLVEEFRRKCQEGDDLVVLLVDGVRKGKRLHAQIIDRPKDGLTALSRTTAFTCAAFARWAMEGRIRDTGVVPPENIGADEAAYRFIVNDLAGHGIVLR
ncbi:MAG: saccharopine dehydrogenase NADP-binding domain-containing protein [Planctomycetes bacterium]|nr:saccharopine dehydrogenase NADP-binding domain-containing protein [Planctomycetota bacterium]